MRFDGAAAGDLAGASVSPAGDVNGDGHTDVIIGAPFAGRTADGSAGGAAYIVYGPFVPGTVVDLATLGDGGVVVTGMPGQSAGRSVAAAGDVNGDGLDDVLVGAPAATPGQESPQMLRGAAYIVFGSRSLPHSLSLANLGRGGIVLRGASHRFPDVFGWDVAPIGDVNRDGLADVAIAAPGNPGFEDSFTRGRAYVVFGRRESGTIDMARLGHAGFRIGDAGPAQLTSVTTAGDWNADGRPDIAVADGLALHGRGAVYVVYGRGSSHAVDLAHLGSRGVVIAGGTVHYRLMGADLAGGQDVDGDHRPDLLVGTPGAHSSGSTPPAGGVWIVRGARSAATVDPRDPGTRAWELRGGRGWMAGSSVALGHLNAGRRADVVTVARQSLSVVYGSTAKTTLQLSSTPPQGVGRFIDGLAFEPPLPPQPPLITNAGTGGFASVAVVADVNRDGRDELLAGAVDAGHNDRARAGAVYLLFSS
jgi:hypothetical protein